MRNRLPWWLRIFAKICLSRIPLSYGFWKRLRLFEHGDMEQPVRAWDTFLMHARTGNVLDESGQLPRLKSAGDGPLHVLELGPGDSLFGGLIAQSLGAAHTWLVDTGRYAVTDIGPYKLMCAHLCSKGLLATDVSRCTDIEDILKAGTMTYLTNGVSSLREIPNASVDYCVSNAVLEHVDLNDFGLLVSELRRILKPDGCACHRVDLKDHLGGGLNNLRFSQKTWEGSFFKSSGFYTNRIRFSNMKTIFSTAGFRLACPRIVKWGQLPIDRNSLDSSFRGLADEDLLVSGFDVVMKLDKTAD
jgi:SAM-dependent methyltransferase